MYVDVQAITRLTSSTAVVQSPAVRSYARFVTAHRSRSPISATSFAAEKRSSSTVSLSFEIDDRYVGNKSDVILKHS